MRRQRTALIAAAVTALLALVATMALTLAPAGAQLLPPPPPDFFGIAPQTPVNDADAQYMQAGGISTIRVPVSWAGVQPSPRKGYDWSGLDDAVEVAADNGLAVLPFFFSTPHWLGKPTTLPVDSVRERTAWKQFLATAVARYGPHGQFWIDHWRGSEDPVPKMPIRSWQIWNEANFFYFAYPVSPSRYASLVTLSSQAIKTVDPGAKVILSGLFGKPTSGGARGMPAADFLEDLYRTPGIKNRFDGVALHPYALDTETLEGLVEDLHDVTVENHDRVPMYITEMGWGSQNDFNTVAFEQGVQGQVRELRNAYDYLLENSARLDLKQVYWFSWKDLPDSCNFCDSVGLFQAGKKFRAKPSWHTFVSLTGGTPRP